MEFLGLSLKCKTHFMFVKRRIELDQRGERVGGRQGKEIVVVVVVANKTIND